MSTLAKQDLLDLGIQPGEIFALIFRVTKGMDREDALGVAQQIRDGVWAPPKRQTVKMTVGSVWHWLAKHPCIAGESNSQVLRWINEGAISLNFHTDWDPSESMPEVITELTLFPSGVRKTILWCLSCVVGSCAAHNETPTPVQQHTD
jgi:hypothetical protein